MEVITNVLYWLSTGLLVPVVVFLLFFFARSLFMIGALYGRYVNRSKVNVAVRKQLDNESVGQFLDSPADTQAKGEFMEYIRKIGENRDSIPTLNRLLGDYEVYADKELGKSKLITKIGPILGLMGTLIPMGPALVGLSTGDVASMANNMQVAFATTVVGLTIGAIGFITLQVKQRWFADDMNILEYIVESLEENKY